MSGWNGFESFLDGEKLISYLSIIDGDIDFQVKELINL